MTTLTERIINAHQQYPSLGATQIAWLLNTHDAFVRAVAQRKGLKLPRSPYGKVTSQGAAWIAAKRTRMLSE